VPETESRDLSAELERVVARFAQLVREVGARHGLSAADVDEVFQDVRIRLWHARPDREQISGLPALYVYRAAVSAARDVLRRRRRAEQRSLPLDDSPPELMVAAQSPVRTLEREELLRSVERALEALAPPRRVVVRMHLRGYDRDEIAKALGWTDGKTRNLLYRGLADLRRRLEADGVQLEGRR
jgi:RNA polymerase sigma-70 factor (ECF subfamily)